MITRWGDFGWGSLDRSFAALEDFRRRMDRLFEDYNQLGEEPFSGERGWPLVNLRDDGAALVLDAEVPGLGESDVQLSLNQNVLTLSGERPVAAPEGYAVHRQERGSVRFSRSYSLPCVVDPEKTTAQVKDGILTVRLEKAPEARPRQITVKAS